MRIFHACLFLYSSFFFLLFFFIWRLQKKLPFCYILHCENASNSNCWWEFYDTFSVFKSTRFRISELSILYSQVTKTLVWFLTSHFYYQLKKKIGWQQIFKRLFLLYDIRRHLLSDKFQKCVPIVEKSLTYNAFRLCVLDRRLQDGMKDKIACKENSLQYF